MILKLCARRKEIWYIKVLDMVLVMVDPCDRVGFCLLEGD